MTLKIDSLLNNRYRIVSILGQGGMGAVYKAEDENLNIAVAVKENLFLSDEYARQFKREANILASIRHPNLPHVTDYFSIEGQGQYLIMNFIEGEDLRKRIERLGSIPPRETVIIGSAICDALSYLHNRYPPIIHRDIKPGNIKITPDGEAVLVDFGLAKIMQGSQNTTTGARAMTPGYSPPEQYGTARTDPRSDFYSLGATLYAALTGVIPEDSLSRATGKTELTSLRTLQPQVSRRLASVIEKSLSVDQEDRYESAEEFKIALIEEFENLKAMTRPRFTVSPPPEESLAGEQNGGSDNDAGKKRKFALEPISNHKKYKSKPKRKGAARVLVPSIILLAAVLTGFYYFGPVIFPRAFSQWVQPGTQVAAQTTQPAPTSIAEVITTEAPTSGEETQSATAEPGETNTPAQEPTSTAEETESTTPVLTEAVVEPQFGGGTGEIIFASDRTGTIQLWIMNADGTQQRQLTDFDDGVCQPSWSPDGKRLAVISPCQTKKTTIYKDARIYLLDADGTNPELLPVSEDAGNFDPAWSPDGQSIAFTSLRNETPHIFVYNLYDETLAEISNTRYTDLQPVWRPGSKQIAFVRQMAYNHIWVMTDRGQSEFQYSTSGNVNDFWPKWTPDGETLLFSRSQEDQFLPWLLSLDYEDRGKAETRIPSLAESDLSPISQADISPDAQWLVYESWPDGRNHDIYLMDMEGENKTRLTTDPGYDFNPVWRPILTNNE